MTDPGNKTGVMGIMQSIIIKFVTSHTTYTVLLFCHYFEQRVYPENISSYSYLEYIQRSELKTLRLVDTEYVAGAGLTGSLVFTLRWECPAG